MKSILGILFLLFSMTAFGQTLTEEEKLEIERAPVLRCNLIKTPWHLYRAQSHIRKVPKCLTPGCVKRNIIRSEKSFCKAVNVCDTMADVLNEPCTPDNRLTEEARANAKEGMKQFLDVMIEKSLEIVKKIRDEIFKRGGRS